MTAVELPNGDAVESGDVILFEGYPYRVDTADGIRLSPVFWGDSELDLSFDDEAELAAQWGEESRGILDETEWEAWLAEARRDERFGDAEVDAIADAVRSSPTVLGRIRRFLGIG